MAAIASVVPGQPVEATWGNTVRDHLVQRFANMAAVAPAIPTPVAGQVIFTEDTKQLWVRYDGVWNAIAASGTTQGFILGSVQIAGKAGVLGNEGGQLNFDAAPSAPTASWAIDVYNGVMRFFTGSTTALQLQATSVLALRLLEARAGIKVTGGVADIDAGATVNGTTFTVDVTGGYSMDGVANSHVSSDKIMTVFGGTEVRLQVAGAGKKIIFYSAGYYAASFMESGGYTDFKANIPPLGGGGPLTIMPAGNNQIGRQPVSSLRVKQDIATYDADVITALRPVTFRYKPGVVMNEDGETHVGLVAEEVAEVAPEYVQWNIDPDCSCMIPAAVAGRAATYDANGNVVTEEIPPNPAVWQRNSGVHTCWRPENVDYARLVVPLIALAKRQDARITELEERVSTQAT